MRVAQANLKKSGRGMGMVLYRGGLQGMGAVDAYGNAITYDNNGNEILNYPDGSPTTDASGNTLSDPNPIASAQVSQAYATADQTFTTQQVNPPSSTSATQLLTNIFSSIFSPAPAATPAPAGSAVAVSSGISPNIKIMAIVGLGGLVVFKLFKKK